MKVKPAANTASFASVPAPVGGLNAYDSLVMMPETDAIALENLVPQPYGCALRRGFQKFNTDYPDYVVSAATWAQVDGTNKVFTWSDNKFYDATISGAIGAPLLSGLNTSWWNPVQFANAAGVHMLAFSGLDEPIWYSAAGVQRLTVAAGPGQITGVNPASLVQATVHQRRLWAVQVNTTKGWYLAADAVVGAMSAFDFGPFFKKGGYLAALTTWTVDDGDGAEDHLVAISSVGEAVVFSGTDVAVSTSWALVGVYFIGAPVAGRRFFANVSGDLLVLTRSGIVSMAVQVTSTRVNNQANQVYSAKIQTLLSEVTSTNGDLPGWQLIFISSINLLFINIPTPYAIGSGQLVYNTINQGWCSFSGMDAAVWVVVDTLPYFGGKNVFNRAWYGSFDDVNVDGTAGTEVQGFVRQAYSYMQEPTLQKQVGMYRPNFISQSKVSYYAEILYDFKTPSIGYPNPSPPSPFSSLWGIGLWGLSNWGGGLMVTRDWSQANGIGVAASITMRMSAPGEAIWVSTDYTFKGGGPL